MTNLEVYFSNAFQIGRVSNPRLQKFAEDNIQRMSTNNPGGIYNTLISDTTSSYTGYFGALADKALQKAVLEAKTVDMDDKLQIFKSFVSRQEGLIRSKWGKDAPEYQEFYPQGVTEYTNATLATVEVIMNRYVKSCVKYSADLGVPFVDEITLIQTNFINSRTSQLNLKGVVEGAIANTDTNRSGIETQLMKNVLIIASNNIGNTEAVKTYFDQSIIRPDKKDIKTGKLAAGATKNIVDRKFELEDEIRLKNLSGAALKFGFVFSADTAVIDGVIVEVEQELIVTAQQLGKIEEKYLNVTNASATHPGEYEVEFL